MNIIKNLATLCTVLFAFSSAATAAPINWTLQNVVFNDGGTANGSFTYDVDTGTYSAIAINTTAGSILGAQSYTILLPGSGTLDFGFSMVDIAEPDLTGNLVLSFVLTESMTNLGGTIALGPNSVYLPFEGFCNNAACSTGNIYREIVSGSVFGLGTSVPEPGLLGLFGFGLVGLGAARRRRTIKK